MARITELPNDLTANIDTADALVRACRGGGGGACRGVAN